MTQCAHKKRRSTFNLFQVILVVLSSICRFRHKEFMLTKRFDSIYMAIGKNAALVEKKNVGNQ